MRHQQRVKKWAYATVLIVIFAIEFLLRDVLLPVPPQDIYIALAVMVEWLMLLLLVFYWIPRVEGETLRSIGFGNFRWRYLWAGILTYLLLMIAWVGSGFALAAMGREGLRSLQPMIRGLSFPIRLSLFLTGTFFEEMVYRGYLIERLTSLAGRAWLAGLASWALFTLVHVKLFGLGPVLEVGILSAALVALYLRERSLWPCIVVHGINGVFGWLIGPLLTM